MGSYKVDSCYGCKYVEQDDGQVEGNSNCPNGPPNGPPDTFRMNCPNYASLTCYTGAATHSASSEQVDEVYKGKYISWFNKKFG